MRTRVYTKVKLYTIARSFVFLKRQEKIRLNKLNKIKRILRRFFHIYKGVRNSKITIKSNEKKNGRSTSKAESSLVLKKKIWQKLSKKTEPKPFISKETAAYLDKFRNFYQIFAKTNFKYNENQFLIFINSMNKFCFLQKQNNKLYVNKSKNYYNLFKIINEVVYANEQLTDLDHLNFINKKWWTSFKLKIFKRHAHLLKKKKKIKQQFKQFKIIEIIKKKKK